MIKGTLYTTHCPQCVVLESLLKDNNVEYDVVTDVKVMRTKGFLSAPRFEVDGKIMDMKETMIWLKETK